MISRPWSERSTKTTANRSWARIADGVISNLAVDLAILGDDQVRIAKHLFGRFEADLVLREIAFGFLRPPGEFDVHAYLTIHIQTYVWPDADYATSAR